ncbi:YheT family hydrolase [Picosynechococcus sp. NKBG15041c]|uniref:YheT family hydrolase n=1 Tax=Picosynechococcus sp. NKBG15041c TaxID=1407650 RepID=UPI000408E489|nr:alpha/beta fold hydrolase [Picosynechococcus sp. NKBG15041c]
MFYQPPLWLRSGVAITIYTAFGAAKRWRSQTKDSPPEFQDVVLTGANQTPLFCQYSQPQITKGTIVATYGITGSLEDQWFLEILAHKAHQAGYGILFFDWRAHGKTAALSPDLTSDGLYEGEDFVRLAAQGKQHLGLKPPFFFTGYSLGGQLALWGLKKAQELNLRSLGLEPGDILAGAVICPSLESHRSLSYLEQHPLKRNFEQAIAKNLQKLAWQLHTYHPDSFQPEMIEKATTIREFDQYLVIPPLGFATTKDYYEATSPLYFLGDLQRPTFILYAADDPLFVPDLVDDLEAVSRQNKNLDTRITRFGGHVGYVSDRQCQDHWGDSDPWWAWQRILDWFDQRLDPQNKKAVVGASNEIASN